MKSLLKIIDSISELFGKYVSWFFVALVLEMTLEVILRHFFNKPQIWSTEVALMLGATAYALGWAYVHRYNSHTRIDVIYVKLPKRVQAIIDTVGFLVLFAPCFILLCKTSLDMAMRSFRIHETMQESYWYPPIAPLRFVVFIGFVLLTLQGFVQFFRDTYYLIRNRRYE